MTTSTRQKKSRLRKVLILAAAIGCSSASLSGALGVFALQQPAHAMATGFA